MMTELVKLISISTTPRSNPPIHVSLSCTHEHFHPGRGTSPVSNPINGIPSSKSIISVSSKFTGAHACIQLIPIVGSGHPLLGVPWPPP